MLPKTAKAKPKPLQNLITASLSHSSKMVERNRESDSDATPAKSSYYTVFIDTNLDTHLAMIVSDLDTVFDLKKKIMGEHPQCFPSYGKININALKVKRKGHFYHLSDSMLVRSAFEGARKTWFLSVDISSLKQDTYTDVPSKLDANNQMALVCVTKTASGGNDNHQPNSSSKRISLLDISPLHQDECVQYTNQKVPSMEQFGPDGSYKEAPKGLEINPKIPTISQSGPGDSYNEVHKDLDTVVKHVAFDPCKQLFCDSNWRSDYESGKCDQLMERNKIPETHVQPKDGNSEVGGNDEQSNNLPEGSLRSGPGLKEKHRSKKENKDALSTCLVHVGPEHTSGKTGGVVLKDMEMENMDVGKGHCNLSFHDTNLRSNTGEILGTNVESRNDESRNLAVDVHCNNSLEEASESRPAAKKKRKRESKTVRNPPEENKKEIPIMKAIIPESSVMEKQKHATVSTDKLFMETPENSHLAVDTGSGLRKRKRKKKSKDLIITAEPSSLHDVGAENCVVNVEIVSKDLDKGNVEIVGKDLDKTSDAPVVSEHDVQHAIPSGGCSQKERHPEPVQALVGDKLPSPSTGKCGAPEPDSESRLKGTKKSKKHRSTNVKELPPPGLSQLDNLENIGHSGGEHTVHDDHKVGTSDPEKVEEQRELAHNCCAEEILLGKCEPPSPGGVDMHTGEAVGSANLAETNIIRESGKSAGSKRIKKRAKKSFVAKSVMSSYSDNSTTGISTMEPPLAFHDRSSDGTQKEESKLCQTKDATLAKPYSYPTSLIGANGEGDGLYGNGAESPRFTLANKSGDNEEKKCSNLEKRAKNNGSFDAKRSAASVVNEQENKINCLQKKQIGMTPEKTENLDAEPKRKTKKNKKFASKSQPALPIKELEVGGPKSISLNDRQDEELVSSNVRHGEELISLNDRQREVDNSSKTGTRTKSVKASSKNELSGHDLGPEENAAMEVFKKGNGDDINFKDYFVPGENKHETAPVGLVVDGLAESKKPEMGVKEKKSTKKRVNHGSERKSHGKNSFGIEHKDLAGKDEHNEVGLQSKSLKGAENEAKAPNSHEIKQIKTVSQEHRGVANGCKPSSSMPAYPNKNSEAADATSSSSSSKKEVKRQSSVGHRRLTVSKGSSKSMDVINGSRHEKSLLATPGSIFKDYSSESSEDENGTVNSDASTLTPSDNSSSSGNSEGKSKSSLDSLRTGVDGAKGNSDARSDVRTKTPHPLDITMDMIFRSSSRFKKAKLSAAQSQLEDLESQRAEFVPDSQPNQ